jgi:transcriptional regulator with XRE-family HTH domain
LIESILCNQLIASLFRKMIQDLIKQGVLVIGQLPVDEAVLRRYAEAVKDARGQRSQREFAELLSVSQSTVHNWEKAKTAPDLEGVEKIARIRGQLPEELLTEIYGRKAEASLQERVEAMSDKELAWLMMIMAQRMAKTD